MAVTFANFVWRDLSSIEITKVQDLDETADWLELNLPQGSTVNRAIVQYGTLLYTTPDGGNNSVRVGDNIAVDSNNKIFKLDQNLVDAFFDQVP